MFFICTNAHEKHPIFLSLQTDCYSLKNYSSHFKIKINMTPGTPRNPAIKAVSGLIAMLMSQNPPIKLNRNNKMPPIIPL